ncbi:MAG: cytidine/deoxycytidylate deaminase family protein [Candidatus Aureabacteria bacterium]|nr:cytidine/deoxycytidylate deaminase family protein [Candidatus Auribacterota bacterium]
MRSIKKKIPAKKDNRPSWDEYFMEIARLVAQRSTCLRRKVGAIIVKDKHVLATGYNGVPSGLKHCLEIGCIRIKNKIPSGQRHELCRGLHAEMNVLIQSAKFGVSIENSTIYSTTHPCILCAKMIINAGIKKVVIREGYPDEDAVEMFKEAGVKIKKI